jgi:bacillopeptidase F (M6 metalloprotease family)
MAQTQKQGKSTDAKQDEWDRDLHPHSEEQQPEKAGLNAYEIKELHSLLEDYTDDELKQITVLPSGSRLKQGSKYINLKDPARQEFMAMGAIEAEANGWYVPKTEIDYQLWNRLTGVENPERLGEANAS